MTPTAHRLSPVLIPLMLCGAAVGQDRGLSQDLDLLVLVDALPDGSYEAFIDITADIDLSEVRIQAPGEPSEPFVSFDPGSFEYELDADATLTEFLTDDATGRQFDILFTQASGAVSVYRFTVSDVFGPQIDLATLPGFASSVDVVPGSPDRVEWQRPAVLGDAVLVRGENADFDATFLELSPIPLPVPLLITPPPTLQVTDESVSLAPGIVDDLTAVEVSYLKVLGSFAPVRISGPELSIGNAAGIYLSIREIEVIGNPCPADLAAPFGSLNFFDISAFIGLFNAGDPAADFAAPFGSLNFFDVAEYIAQFNAGCP